MARIYRPPSGSPSKSLPPLPEIPLIPRLTPGRATCHGGELCARFGRAAFRNGARVSEDVRVKESTMTSRLWWKIRSVFASKLKDQISLEHHPHSSTPVRRCHLGSGFASWRSGRKYDTHWADGTVSLESVERLRGLWDESVTEDMFCATESYEKAVSQLFFSMEMNYSRLVFLMILAARSPSLSLSCKIQQLFVCRLFVHVSVLFSSGNCP